MGLTPPRAKIPRRSLDRAGGGPDRVAVNVGRGRMTSAGVQRTEPMKRSRIWILAAGACAAALAVVAVVALPASGTAPAGSSFFAKLDGEHEVPAADPD